MLPKSKIDETLPVDQTWCKQAPVIFLAPKAFCRILNVFPKETNFDKSLKIISVVEKSQNCTVNTLILA